MAKIVASFSIFNNRYLRGATRQHLEPFIILAVFAIAIGFAIYYAQDFALDASSDTLLDQNDPQLEYYLTSRERFVGAEDFLVLTYTPNNDGIFTPATLQQIDRLQRRLEEITGVASVYSILDAPLLKSPPMSLPSSRKCGKCNFNINYLSICETIKINSGLCKRIIRSYS